LNTKQLIQLLNHSKHLLEVAEHTVLQAKIILDTNTINKYNNNTRTTLEQQRKHNMKDLHTLTSEQITDILYHWIEYYQVPKEISTVDFARLIEQNSTFIHNTIEKFQLTPEKRWRNHADYSHRSNTHAQ